jgi:hypothetical protein
MTSNNKEYREPSHDGLHPAIYKTLAGLVLWLIISVWIFFSRGQYMALNVVPVSGILIVMVGIPFIIWSSWRRQRLDQPPGSESFRDWTRDKFQTSTGPLSGREAATLILLPIVAVSVGMTIFGLVLYFSVPNLGYS